MPESFFTFRIIEFEEKNLAITFEWSCDIPIEPLVFFINTFFSFWVEEAFIESGNSVSVFDLRNDDLVSELLTNLFGDIVWRGLKRGTSFDCTIWKGDLDFISWETYTEIEFVSLTCFSFSCNALRFFSHI